MDFAELSTSTTAVGGAVVAALGAVYKALKALLEFHDEYLRKRKFKHYAFLSAEVASNEQMRDFVDSVKHSDVFRATFGKPLSPNLAVAVMQLYKSGRFSLDELRASATYMRLGGGDTLTIEPGKAATFILWASVGFLSFMVLYAGAIITSLLTLRSPTGAIAAVAVLVFTFAVATTFGRDIGNVLLARRAAKKLAKVPR